MKKRTILSFLVALAGFVAQAQTPEIVRKYIDTYKEIAIAEEIRTGVPAAITLAQGIHESGAGTSFLVGASNNHFGIKCKSDWTGEKVYHDDDAKGECFRKYEDPFQSYRDHSDFLKNRPYYTALFQLDPTDYKGWAYGLKKAGYATNPKYPEILIRIIENYELQQYTLLALNGKPSGNPDVVTVSNTLKSESQNNAAAPQAQAAVVRSQYPSGIFHINNTRVVLVERGTSFLKIADEYNLGLARLFEFNDMEAMDIAPADMLIFLQRKRKTGNEEFHIVRTGETLQGIAQAQGIRLENLLEFNSLKANMQVQAGEALYLQYKAPAMPKLASARTTR